MNDKLKKLEIVLNEYTGFSGKIKVRGGFILYTLDSGIYSMGENANELIKTTVFLCQK